MTKVQLLLICWVCVHGGVGHTCAPSPPSSHCSPVHAAPRALSSSVAPAGRREVHGPAGNTDLVSDYLFHVTGRLPTMPQGLFPFCWYDGLASGHVLAEVAGSIPWVLPGLLLYLCSPAKWGATGTGTSEAGLRKATLDSGLWEL